MAHEKNLRLSAFLMTTLSPIIFILVLVCNPQLIYNITIYMENMGKKS